MWLISRLVTHLISYYLISPVLHRWCMEQTSRECPFWQLKIIKATHNIFPRFFLRVCVWGFLFGSRFLSIRNHKFYKIVWQWYSGDSFPWLDLWLVSQLGVSNVKIACAWWSILCSILRWGGGGVVNRVQNPWGQFRGIYLHRVIFPGLRLMVGNPGRYKGTAEGRK